MGVMNKDGYCKDHDFWYAIEDTCPVCDGMELMRKQIIANIMDRVLDLKSCSKNDNCWDMALKIQSYIPEWTE